MLRTMKEVLSEGIPGHELSHQQSLIALAATPDEISEPAAAELPHRPRFLLRHGNQIRISNRKIKIAREQRTADGRGTGGRPATRTC